MYISARRRRGVTVECDPKVSKHAHLTLMSCIFPTKYQVITLAPIKGHMGLRIYTKTGQTESDKALVEERAGVGHLRRPRKLIMYAWRGKTR